MSDEHDDIEQDLEDEGVDPSKPLRLPRRERAVQLRLAGHSKVEAYAQAGYQRDRNHAWQLFDIPEVQKRIEYLLALDAERASEERAKQRMAPGFSKADAMVELELARKLAMLHIRPSAAVAAVIGKCKLEGLIRDVPAVDAPMPGDMSVDQLERYIADLAAAERHLIQQLHDRGLAEAAAPSPKVPRPLPN